MYLLLDFIVVVILLVFLFQGKRKGFVLTLCGLLALVVAFVGASLLARYLAPPIAQAVTPQISSALEEYIQADLPTQSTEDSLRTILENFGFYDQLIGTIEETIVAGTDQVLTTVASTVALSVCYLVIFLITFILVLIGWYFLSHTIDFVFKLPGLNFLNSWGGAALGLVRGAIFLFIIGWLLQYMGNLIPEDTVSQTYLLKIFLESSPTQLITNLSALSFN